MWNDAYNKSSPSTTPMTTLTQCTCTSTDAWRTCTETARASLFHSLMMTPHTSWLKFWAHFIVTHGHNHGRSPWLDLSLCTSTSSSCLSPSPSYTWSCSLSSTTRSSWQTCAAPLQKRVRTPWTLSPLTQFVEHLRSCRRGHFCVGRRHKKKHTSRKEMDMSGEKSLGIRNIISTCCNFLENKRRVSFAILTKVSDEKPIYCRHAFEVGHVSCRSRASQYGCDDIVMGDVRDIFVQFAWVRWKHRLDYSVFHVLLDAQSSVVNEGSIRCRVLFLKNHGETCRKSWLIVPKHRALIVWVVSTNPFFSTLEDSWLNWWHDFQFLIDIHWRTRISTNSSLMNFDHFRSLLMSKRWIADVLRIGKISRCHPHESFSLHSSSPLTSQDSSQKLLLWQTSILTDPSTSFQFMMTPWSNNSLKWNARLTNKDHWFFDCQCQTSPHHLLYPLFVCFRFL